jgi:hypothetical protein
MPKGLKPTSGVIVISDRIVESTASTFISKKTDLQLNVLDREVFVVLAVDIDVEAPTNRPNSVTDCDMSVSTTGRTTVGTIADSNVLAHKNVTIQNNLDTAVAVTEYYSGDTPHANLEYIGIIATNDFYLNFEGQGNATPRSGSARIWGYRAQADAATFAALTQSELLSA